MVELTKKQQQVIKEAEDMIKLDISGEGLDYTDAHFDEVSRHLLYANYAAYLRYRNDENPWESSILDSIISGLSCALMEYREVRMSYLMEEGRLDTPAERFKYIIFGDAEE